MQSFRSKLEQVARGIFDRVETAYRARRAPPPPPAPPEPAPSAPPAPAPSPKPVNWELRTQAELVDHIEQHYHAGLRRDLPALIEGARRVEREHAGHASVPGGLASLLESFESELESHMQKEERMLFPVLRTGSRGGPVDMPIRMMEREHDDHDAALERIRELTHGLAAPADASPAWQELYAGLAGLEEALRQHIYLENNVLFARARGGEY